MEPEWIREIAFDKSVLFLKSLNLQWRRTEKLVEDIHNILEEHGVKSGHILDLCCGNGRFSVHMAKKGYKVTGVDISRPFIEDARKKAEEYGVTNNTYFIECDARNLRTIRGRIAEPFDVVISAWTSIGYYDRDTDLDIFRQARDLSKDDAVLMVLETDHQAQAMTPPRNRRSPWYRLDDETVVLEYSVFDPQCSRIESTWSFYRRDGENLLFLDRTKFDYHVYSLSELFALLRAAGWEVETCYGNLTTREQITPQTSLNLIAKAS